MFLADKFNDLVKKYEENKLSHAFLIETNNFDLCYDDIKKFLKIINCPRKYEETCSEDCNLCKLIDIGNLPNLILVQPEGMSIKKTQLLELQEKFSTKPVYSKYNMYIIKDAEFMNEAAANCILKFLEEPTDNILGIFVTCNKENVIDTIKSRCQIIKVYYQVKKELDKKVYECAKYYLEQVTNNCDLIINKEYILPVFSTRIEVNNLFLCILDILMSKINQDFLENDDYDVLQELSLNSIKKMIIKVDEILNLIQYNVNLELLLDKFVIEMRNIHD